MTIDTVRSPHTRLGWAPWAPTSRHFSEGHTQTCSSPDQDDAGVAEAHSIPERPES